MKNHILRPNNAVLGLFVLILGLFLPISCTKEVFKGFEDEESVEMVITVGAGTKTAMQGESTVWTNTDALTVIHAPSDGGDFWASRFGYTGENAFTGKVKRLSDKNDWFLIYPYKEEDNVAADQISLTFPSSQEQDGKNNMSHLAGDQIPLWGRQKEVAKGNVLNVQMQNLLAVAGFKVKNTMAKAIVIEQIQFTATTPVAGEFSLDLTAENPAPDAGSNATKTVTLSVTGEARFDVEEEGWFYLAFAPFDAAEGGKLKVKTIAKDEDGASVVFYNTITLTSPTSFSAGSIKTVNVPCDLDHTTNPDAASGTSVVVPVGGEPAEGTYLLVYDEPGKDSYAFAAFADMEDVDYAIPVIVQDGVVLPSEEVDLATYAIRIEKAGIKHPNNPNYDAYNVLNSAGKYIFYSHGALRIMDTNQRANEDDNNNLITYYHTFVGDSDGVQIMSSGANGYSQYLLTYNDASGFHYSKEEADQGKKLHLYLLGEGAGKEMQTLVFDKTSVEYDFDHPSEFVEPVLSGNRTAVRYSSNNESVAKVDEDGNVTILGAGTVVITATAEADDYFYSATASYTIYSNSNANRVFYLTTELEANQEYLIVSGGKALTNNNGSIAATTVSPANGEISIAESASMVWVSAQSGSGFSFVNAGKYITTTSSNNPSPSLGNTATAWNYDGSSNYLSYSQSYYGMSFDSYLYYSSSSWTLGNSYSGTPGTVALYSATRPATKQTLSFEKSTDRWYVGEGEEHQIGRTYDILPLDDAYTEVYTEVTYTSSNPQVAEIVNNSKIKVKALGSTKITATATAGTVNGIEYKEGSASYTLYIKEPVTGDWIELEGSPFNLENADVKAYLDAAAISYTGSSISSTIVGDYAPGGKYSTITSKTTDYGQPVTIDWGTQSSGTATITILADDKETEVWTQTASSGSTSSKVYNLIPGETYYCTVEDNTGYLLKGVFETTGRRRMIKISEGTSEYYARNCRDLGGLETIDGGRIKYGMIFRGTNLDSTSDSEQSYMANDLNIGWDIDLRQSSEGKNAFASKYGVTWVMCDFNAYVNSSHLTNATKVQKTMMGFINAAKAGKASYFHCRIGSDRTGYWGLIIEGLLGVNLQDCSMDYELTSFANNIGTLGNRIRTSGLFKDGVTFLQGLSYYDENDPNWLQNTIKQYLINDVKIPETDINYFINALVEYDY